MNSPAPMRIDEDSWEHWDLMLRVAHGLADFEPSHVVSLFKMEATAAAISGRERIFMGTTGPWMRIEAPADRPLFSELVSNLVISGCVSLAVAAGGGQRAFSLRRPGHKFTEPQRKLVPIPTEA